MASINPYLNFNGNTEEVFTFYKSVFGGEFSVLQRFKDMPEAAKLSEEDQNKIMHISLPIGDRNVLMASDAVAALGYTANAGNNFTISITAISEAEAETIFGKLAIGGRVTMPLQKTFWGSYFGMVTDKFSIQWMVSYEYK